jgi:hypothetical protein
MPATFSPTSRRPATEEVRRDVELVRNAREQRMAARRRVAEANG